MLKHICVQAWLIHHGNSVARHARVWVTPMCVSVLPTGCVDIQRTAALLNRQQHQYVYMATLGSSPWTRSSYTVPHCQRSYHSNHQPLSGTTFHWNAGSPEAHTAETHGSSLLDTHSHRWTDRNRQTDRQRRELSMTPVAGSFLTGIHSTPVIGGLSVGHVMHDLF